MSPSNRTRLVDPDHLTLADAADLFLDHIFQRAQAAQVTWGYYHNMRHQMRRIVCHVGQRKPLDHIGRAEIEEAVLHFTARPPALPRPFQTTHVQRPISASTAKHVIDGLKTLLCFVADHDQLAWEKPRGFDRLFKVKQRHMRTPQEREQEAREVVSGEVLTFSLPLLTQLFRAGRARDRLNMLLGLNCGFTSIDLANLHTYEVFLDGQSPFIHKRRNKTGVEAKWILWPETVNLLKRFRAPENSGRRWLLTEYGNPLVEVGPNGRRDAVDQAWKILFNRLPRARWLGFRFLRKTGANSIKRIGGLEESEMYLAHQEPGLNKSYANRNWDRMWNCLVKYREQLPFLGPAWDLEPSECLFTQDSNPLWSDVNPAFARAVTRRSETGVLNVSLNKQKQKYYARVYHAGVTRSRGYTESLTEAAAWATALRQGIEESLGMPAR